MDKLEIHVKSCFPARKQVSSQHSLTINLHPGLAELRNRVRLGSFPADEVLDALCSTAASDGKLTR